MGDRAADTRVPAATEQERDLAHQARQLFEQRNYDKCLLLLNQLSATRGQDPKVDLNKAVVEYYRSGFVSTDEFKKVLHDICGKARMNLDSVSSLEDVDHCILYYNHAVILYNLRQYRLALIILDKLFQLIEPMEESLSRKVLFLLIELYLCTHQPNKAMGVLGFVEKMLFGNGKSQLLDKDGTPLLGAAVAEAFPSNHPNEVWRPKVNLFKVRCMMMMKSLKLCKRELKGLLTNANTVSSYQSIPVNYLKANFEYLRSNMYKAIKVLNSLPQPGRATSDMGDSTPMMYYNNMAVLHFHLRKHHLGAFYLRKAVQENALAVKEYNTVDPTKSLSGRPLNTIAVSHHYELLYNMGVQLLHCGQPNAAFECLMQTVQLFQINPRLWLRLAECCIMAHRENNDEDRKTSKQMEVIQGSVGSGVHRKLILGQGLRNDNRVLESSAIPAVTLEFASMCLKNALLLLPEDPVNKQPPSKPAEGDQGERPVFDPGLVLAPPGNPMRGFEVANLRCSILAASSYVSLCLNDYLFALRHAEQLLKQPRLSGAHSFLGHQYQAEALVALDKIADAVSHLDPDLVTDVTTTFPENKADLDKDKNGDKDPSDLDEVRGALYPWSPRDVPRARAIAQYNLATAHAVRGEFEKALDNLSKSTLTIGFPLPAQMYFLKLYLELMEGRRKAAQSVIKEHFGHVTPNRV